MATSTRSRELTQMELAVTIILVVVFVWTTIHKLSALEAAAEHASFTATVNRMKSAMMVEALSHLVRNDRAALATLEQLNPMDLMAHPPFNYAGVVDSPVGLEPGVWYYLRSRNQLAYVFDHVPRESRGRAIGAHRRFRVRLAYEDRNGDGAFGPGVDEFEGVILEPIEAPSSASDKLDTV